MSHPSKSTSCSEVVPPLNAVGGDEDSQARLLRTHPASSADQESLDLLRLHLATLYDFECGVRCLEAFGSAHAVFRQSPAKVWERLGQKPKHLARRLFAKRFAVDAERELSRATKEGVEIVASTTADYPPPLRALPDRPLVLFAQGVRADSPSHLRLDQSAWLTVGIVGSRRPSRYGLQQARRFATALAHAQIAVVSGLARGVDAEAHRACVDTDGVTIAVLGSGLGRIYPRDNESLLGRMLASGNGAVLTPFPFLTPPRGFHFPLRNSILSGLSALVLVVEAGEKSGTLITVDHALRQGRPVAAIPGRVDDEGCRGCLRLLQDGAALAIEPSDLFNTLINEIGLPLSARQRRRLSASHDGGCSTLVPIDGPLGRELTELFRAAESWHADALAEQLGIAAADLLQELSRLELAGVLERLRGGKYTRSARPLDNRVQP